MELKPLPTPVHRVLSVSAHPDDSEFFAGGTLASFAAAGCEVILVVCTDGGRGGRGIDNIAAVRATEQERAAGILGVTHLERLGYPDGDLRPDPDVRDRLIALIRLYQPDIVLGHDPRTFFTRYGRNVQPGHSDHRASGTALFDAIYPRAGSPHFVPEAGAPYLPRELWLFDCQEPDYHVDVSAGFEKKLAALAAHDSQQGAGGGLVRAARQIAAQIGSDDQPAEAFVRLTLRGERPKPAPQD